MKFYKIRYKQGGSRLDRVVKAISRRKALLDFHSEIKAPVLSIHECSEPFSYKFEAFMKKLKDPIKNKRVNQEQFVVFLEQFSTMIDAGMPVNTSLAQCVEDTNDESIKQIFSNVLLDVESGLSLTNSMKKYEKQLSQLAISLFELGEQTGTLATSTQQLASIIYQVNENKRKLKKATRYPMIIVVSMIIAFSVVITVVVPQFASFFKQSGLDLPLPTKMLIGTEVFLRNYGLYTLVGIILLVAFIRHKHENDEKWRLTIDKIMLKTYIIGKVIYFSMIGRFSYLFKVLSDAGIPMLEATHIARGIIDNAYINKQLDAVSNAIEDGKTLTQGFKESEQFENMIIQMVQAGESSGSLGKMLGKISTIYNNRYNYIVDNISTLIEPILIAVIAVFVLILALGIFLPMWSMVELAG